MLTGTKVWDFSDAVGQVVTGGYWYSFNDNAETADGGPGASKSNFPIKSLTSDNVGPWASTNGMDVTFSINPTTYKYPYAGIGFSWKEPQDTSAQKWTSICIEYSLTGAVPVQMLLVVDPLIDGNNSRYLELPVQDAMGTHCFATSSFAQDAGWGMTITLAQTMANSLGIRFRVQLKTPPTTVQTCHLTIRKVTVQ